MDNKWHLLAARHNGHFASQVKDIGVWVETVLPKPVPLKLEEYEVGYTQELSQSLEHDVQSLSALSDTFTMNEVRCTVSKSSYMFRLTDV